MLVWVMSELLSPQAARIPPEPSADFSKLGVGFYSAGRELPDPVGLEAVRIGVLAPVKNSEGQQIRNGVQMALDDTNLKGGYRRIPYQLVFRADYGPEDVAAPRVVDLAYDDKVWTIIGGLNGQRTHVAELVASKAWIRVTSPAAIDTSVDHANVPWVFRCPPADSRRAFRLGGCAQGRGYKHVLVLTEVQREGHTGFLRLRDKANERRFTCEAHYEHSTRNPEQVVLRLHGAELDTVILLGSARPAFSLLRALRAAGISVPILAHSMLALPETAAGSAGQKTWWFRRHSI